MHIKTNTNKYAFVTFLVMNDSFLPGAIMFAYGIRQQNSFADIVCLASKKISKRAVKALNQLFDKVIIVDELFVNHELRHQRQDRPYLFSRFNALRLGSDGDLKQKYNKIILCDADILPVKNFDALFNLNTPAGIINERKDNCILHNDNGKYVFNDSVFQSGTWHWHEIYSDFLHSKHIPKNITDRILHDFTNLGINSSLWVLTPSYDEYTSIINNISCPKMQSLISQLKWPEMQYATIRWSGKWTNVDLRYSSFNGYPHLDVLYGLHFAGIKPWRYKNLKHLKHFLKYPDYCYWYESFVNMMNCHNYLFEFFSLKKLYLDIVHIMGSIT